MASRRSATEFGVFEIVMLAFGMLDGDLVVIAQDFAMLM
jgi:hypothetical protein